MTLSVHEPDWSFENRWSPEIAALGFTAVPNALLKAYSFLDITPSQFLILVNIDSFRWDAKAEPFPSIETLAARTDLSERTVTRNITALQDVHRLIERVPRGYISNAYSFELGVNTLTNLIRYDNGDILI